MVLLHYTERGGYNGNMNEMNEAIAQKVKHMESKRGRNHPLPQFQSWLNQAGWTKPPLLIQVIGTNGKGSVSWMLNSALEKQGRKTGLFTSPHMESHFERLRVQGKKIPAADWMRLYEQHEDLFESEQMTMFEIDLFMALLWFQEQGCDAVILEAGMGGEFDATTAVDKDLLCYTGTGLDHMAFLGDSLEKIASSKAGAFRRGVPVVCAEENPQILALLQQKADAAGAPFVTAGAKEEHAVFYQKILAVCPQLADHFPPYQGQNASLAFAALQQLMPEYGFSDFVPVVSDFHWPGRYEILRRDPLLVADGAHNAQGIAALCSGLQPGQFARCYFSVLADKQGEEMIRMLEEKIPEVILVDFDSARIADLHALAKKLDLSVITLKHLQTVLEKESQPALVCGSLYFTAEVLKMFSRRKEAEDGS